MFHLNHYPTEAEVAADADTAATADSSSSSRPLKVPRRDRTGFRGASATKRRRSRSPSRSPSGGPDNAREPARSEVEGQVQAAPRTRGITACQRCRSRKTRCDNRRPSCGYCAKLGAPCLYESDASSSCHIVGPQLLEAIGSLTALVQRQHAEQQCRGQCHQQARDALSPTTLKSVDSAQSPLAQIVLRQNQNAQQSGGDVVVYSRPDINGDEQRAVKRQRPIQAQGVETVLKWKIYPPDLNFPNLIGETKIDLTVSHHLPCLEYSELARLESKYIGGVHIKNPILDLPTLHQNILHVSENGLDWSTSTCLVSIVCAIGAITGRYKEAFPSAPNRLASLSGSQDRVIDSEESEVELAMRHWNVAAKRLGYAFGRDDLEAVQCLCLAGIWYMNILQPLQAWKHFSLAGNAWYAATLKGHHSPTLGSVVNRAKSLSLEQSLYFTIYKSECELRVELDLPGSALEDVDLSQTFPLPPTLDGQLSDSETNVTERGWYYYLAEIAARHLINRMLRARSWTQAVASKEEIWRMLTDVELFETQLREWHSSLPPMLNFDIPTGPFIPTYPDELKQILRHRYLTSRELIYRPFVRLCVEHELDSLEPHLRAAVANLATSGLQYCMYKISQVSPQRHQGTWFMMRSYATNSMILLAASKARNNPSFLGAASMVMPQGWREVILQTMREIGPCWDDGPGGVGELRHVVEWALATES